MVGEDTSLLDWLRQRLGAEYLSDLRAMMSVPSDRWRLRVVVTQLRPEEWPLESWVDLAHYLAGTGRDFHSQGEAHRALLQLIDTWGHSS